MANIRKMLLTLPCLAALPATAIGGDGNPFELLEEEAVVTAAAKRPQKLAEAPASAAVITGDEIRLRGYRTLGEALQSVPGFYVTQDRDYSGLWVRGFGRPGDFNSRVLLLLNGHRLNDNIYGQAFIGAEFPVDLASVERIEVVKGPGAALYGDNAFFAIINVVTLTGEQADTRFSSEAGSYGAHRLFAGAGRPFGQDGAVYASASRYGMDGESFTYPEYAASGGGRSKASADREKAKTAYFNLSAGGWTLQADSNERTKHVPTGAYATSFNDTRTMDTDSRSFVEIRRDLRLMTGLDIMARAYYDWYLYRGIFAQTSGDMEKDAARGAWYGGEVCLHYDQASGGIFTLGQEYEENTAGVQSSEITNTGQHVAYSDATPHRWAVYMQQELAPLGPLNLTLGGRYDKYSAFGATFNPRLGAVYALPSGTALKLIAGSAFRAPTPYESDYYYPGDSKANHTLSPEKIYTFELLAERSLQQGGGTVTAGIFSDHIENQINQEIDPADGLTHFVNTERVRSLGLELGSELRLAGDLTAHAGYIMQDTREAGGSRMSNSPVHSGKAGIAWRRPSATASAEVMFIGERRTLRGTRLSPAALLSAHLSASAWPGGPVFRLGVSNIFNTAYYASGGAEHIQAALRQGGRSFIMGADYAF